MLVLQYDHEVLRDQYATARQRLGESQLRVQDLMSRNRELEEALAAKPKTIIEYLPCKEDIGNPMPGFPRDSKFSGVKK